MVLRLEVSKKVIDKRTDSYLERLLQGREEDLEKTWDIITTSEFTELLDIQYAIISATEDAATKTTLLFNPFRATYACREDFLQKAIETVQEVEQMKIPSE